MHTAEATQEVHTHPQDFHRWLDDVAARSWAMSEQANTMRVGAEQAILEARHVRASLTPVVKELADCNSDFPTRYRSALLSGMLDQALKVTGASMGNIQLFDRASAALRIEVQRGFQKPFLQFFDSVHDGHAACGTALENRAQVIVEDVSESRIFAGTPALEVVLDAGVRSVQSTPLVARSGCVLGMISTHRRMPWKPDYRETQLLHRVARTIAEWLERSHCAGPGRLAL
jgi:hypothetical protein